MKRFFGDQVNLNSLLLSLLLGLVTWEGHRLYTKIDSLDASQSDMLQRIARLEALQGLTTTVPKPTVKP